MALELLGGRILSPTYGSSIHVWAAVISVFILSLSIGYWLGGRLADRAESNRVLAWIIIIAAVFYFGPANVYDANARALWQYCSWQWWHVGVGHCAVFAAIVVAGMRVAVACAIGFVVLIELAALPARCTRLVLAAMS